MGKRYRGKLIAFFIIFVIFFSGVNLSLELVLGVPKSSINGELAGIIDIYHEERAEVYNNVSINITFSFGNGASYPHINQYWNYITRTMELVLWRPYGLYSCDFHVQNICYNVTFSRTGVWKIKINLYKGGSITYISVF